MSVDPLVRCRAAFARGDLVAARRFFDEFVAETPDPWLRPSIVKADLFLREAEAECLR